MSKVTLENARLKLRDGITIVEVLVTISVASLLLALALPAIHSTRESARKMQCLDHLRQLSIATQAHSSSNNDQFPFTSTNGGDPQMQRLLPSHSPHLRLLPFVDQSTLHSKVDFDDRSVNAPGTPPSFLNPAHRDLLSIRVPVFLCPSDIQRPGATNYRANMGYGPGVFGPGPLVIAGFPGNVAGAFVHGRSIPIGEFLDGTSNTMLFSEKLIGDGNPQRYTPWTDFFYFETGDILSADEAVQACSSLANVNPPHASYVGWTWVFGGWNSTWYNHILTPNSSVPDCSAGGNAMAGGGSGAYTARSFHRGGVNAAFADGASRFVSERIDLSIWRAISTRDGGESITGWP